MEGAEVVGMGGECLHQGTGLPQGGRGEAGPAGGLGREGPPRREGRWGIRERNGLRWAAAGGEQKAAGNVRSSKDSEGGLERSILLPGETATGSTGL